MTGHTGSKGLVVLLASPFGCQGLRLRVATNGIPNAFDDLRLNEYIHSTFGDVTDRSQLISTLVDCHADIVIHMAAQPLVQKSFRDPYETFNTNVMGTVNVGSCKKMRNCKILRYRYN